MSVYIRGDTHGEYEELFGYDLSKDDVLIVCGDFGIWSYNDKYVHDRMAELPYTILFVCGNHENFDILESEYEVVDYCGGKAHKIRDNIYHLMRGHIFTIQGRTYFAFGGASSHDIQDGILDPDDFVDETDFTRTFYMYNFLNKQFRVKGFSWWDREMPSQEEMDFARKNLKAHGNKVDYIITHCCPQHVAEFFSHGLYEPDVLTTFFDEIADSVSFSDWYFGHYHDDRDISIKYHMLYENMREVLEPREVVG